MNKNMSTLYHGTIHDFTEIDVTKGKANKDFGRGFYTSRNAKHAGNLARRNKKIEERRSARLPGKLGKIIAWLYQYEFDFAHLDALKVKEFETADFEWIDFIAENRDNASFHHDYDVIIGPTANDDTVITLGAFLNNAYGDRHSQRAKEIFLELILPDALPRQIYFGTQKAVTFLKFAARRVIE